MYFFRSLLLQENSSLLTKHFVCLETGSELKGRRSRLISMTQCQAALTSVYTVGQKNNTPNSCSYLRQILTDFQNSFIITLRGKFAIKTPLQIPPRIKGVVTQPCEILVFKNCTDRKHSNGRPGMHILKRV